MILNTEVLVFNRRICNFLYTIVHPLMFNIISIRDNIIYRYFTIYPSYLMHHHLYMIISKRNASKSTQNWDKPERIRHMNLSVFRLSGRVLTVHGRTKGPVELCVSDRIASCTRHLHQYIRWEFHCRGKSKTTRSD